MTSNFEDLFKAGVRKREGLNQNSYEITVSKKLLLAASDGSISLKGFLNEDTPLADLSKRISNGSLVLNARRLKTPFDLNLLFKTAMKLHPDVEEARNDLLSSYPDVPHHGTVFDCFGDGLTDMVLTNAVELVDSGTTHILLEVYNEPHVLVSLSNFGKKIREKYGLFEG